MTKKTPRLMDEVMKAWAKQPNRKLSKSEFKRVKVLALKARAKAKR